MTSIGFTGTREGATISQLEQVEKIIMKYWSGSGPHEWHDGDCIGADSQAHGVVEYLNTLNNKVNLHGHPCNLHDKFHAYNQFHVTHDVKAPLVRNRDIVDQSDVMIACPKEYDEIKVGSGTWATIRYAKKSNKPLFIFWPDGTFTFTP